MGRKPKNTVFYCYTGRANSPVKLERPDGLPEMTDLRFKQMIAMQPIAFGDLKENLV